MIEVPSFAEVQKVREWECASTRHCYDHVEEVGVDGPIAIICRNCGKDWKVER